LDPSTDQVAGEQAPALAQLELAQVDRAAAQASSVGADLADPAAADEHPPAADGPHQSVPAGRLGAEIDDSVRDAPDLGAIRAEERKPGQPGDVDDARLDEMILILFRSLEWDVDAPLVLGAGPEDATL